MKSRITVALSTGLLLSVLLVAPVLAVETTQDDASTSQAQTKKEDLQKRLEKRKEALKTKLTVAQEKRLGLRCKNAQAMIKDLQAKATKVHVNRAEAHKNLVTRLTTLQGKLDSKGADTAKLKTQITELQTKIAMFDTDLATYKQSVADLVDMDCTVDPAGFKASLEEARAELKKVQADSAAVKAYVKDTIKPTLVAIRVSIAGTSEAPGAN